MAEKGEYKRAYLLSDAEFELMLRLFEYRIAHGLFDSLFQQRIEGDSVQTNERVKHSQEPKRGPEYGCDSAGWPDVIGESDRG